LNEAKQTKNYKKEGYCRTDIQGLLRLMEILGRNRSELRANISELKK
jgi:hypothetical protein